MHFLCAKLLPQGVILEEFWLAILFKISNYYDIYLWFIYEYKHINTMYKLET